MTLNFPKSIYTKGEATTANIGNSNPNDGATGTIGSYGFTFDSDRVDTNGRWVMNNGSTYSLTGGATYTWDLYKWKASNIPDSSDVVQTTSTPSNGEFLKWDNGAAVWAASSGGVTVQDEGNALSTTGTTLNFTGNGVTATGTGSTKTIDITDTDTTYTVGDGGLTQNNFTDSLKNKLDGIDSGANVGVPASGGTFTGEVDFDSRVTQEVQTTSWDIDCSAGNYFVRSMTSNTTFVFSNPPTSGTAYSFVLELDLSSAVTSITWPSSVKWPGDTTPVFTVGNKTHLFFFVTDNGGTRWRGAALLDYID